MKKNGKHPINAKAVEICRTLYSIARQDGALLDGKISHPDLQKAKHGWAKRMTEEAERFATRVISDVVVAAVRPYEKAFNKYAYAHLQDCSFWRDADCDCGLDEIRHQIKNGFSLHE